ncbi:carbamoyltransferase [Dietzia sp. 2505]|uniref:carbamoyltransferase C-terminal domain-containing protein n=1 Tax=Dietzia sp. 2505 TaxID=3156457 RepID=UPI003392EC6A
MAVLGLYEGHNAGAALISETSGLIVAAVEEERFSRIKNHDARPHANGMPRRSLDWVLSVARRHGETITTIAIGLMDPDALAERALVNFDSAVRDGEPQRLTRAQELGLDNSELRELPRSTQTVRLERAVELLRASSVAVDDVDLVLVEHHLAHAAAAFLTSPVDDALVVTLDGKGDDLSGSIWLGRGSALTEIALIPTEHSLGHVYSAATVACGFRPQRDEGKFMALAAHGRVDRALDRELRRWLFFDDSSGLPVSRLNRGIVQGPYPDRIPGFHNSRMTDLIAGCDRIDVAATVQRLLEEVVLQMVTHHLAATGEHAVVVSGGLFANVSVNNRIGRLPQVRELHVHPGMTDSGVALGAASWAFTQRAGHRPIALRDLGLGPHFSEEEAVAAFIAAGYRRQSTTDPVEGALAEALSRGFVVARFDGGCEYGPRALGHRSILAPAHDPEALRDLNDRLGRSQMMPFAPMVLAEWAPLLFSGWEVLRGSMRFMTTAVDCTPRARAEMPAAIHADGTARPQLVDPDIEPNLAYILTEYQRLSGRMGLVNTSFNLHDEPIVCTPEEAAHSAATARIAAVQVERSLLVKDSYAGCD